MTIYEQMVEVLRPEQIDHHASDLYVECTDESRKIIRNSNLIYRIGYETFVDQKTNRVWYDIAFAFDPFWDENSEYYHKM